MTVLGYSRTEYRFMPIGEICEQLEIHAAFCAGGGPAREEDEF